jgi:hypothetical protein
MNKRNNKDLLNGQIEADILGLSTMESGSEEKQKEVENLTKLYKLQIEESRNEREAEEARKKTKIDKVKTGAEIGLGVLNVGTLCYWMHKTFKFEEIGTITSCCGRSVFQKIMKLLK